MNVMRCSEKLDFISETATAASILNSQETASYESKNAPQDA